MNYFDFASANARKQASEAQGGLSPIRSEALLDDPKCSCPGFHKDGVWFPMVFDKDCPLHGSSNAPAEARAASRLGPDVGSTPTCSNCGKEIHDGVEYCSEGCRYEHETGKPRDEY